MNPFDEDFAKKVQPNGMSSADIQRNSYIHNERIKFLFKLVSDLQEEVNKLKIAKTAPKRKVPTKAEKE